MGFSIVTLPSKSQNLEKGRFCTMPNSSPPVARKHSIDHLDTASLDDSAIDSRHQLLTPADLAKESIEPSTRSKLSSETDDSASEEKRDEIQEIRNRSRHEDRSVHIWRSALLFLILVIGVTVSGLTFYFLREEENKALNLAVRRILYLSNTTGASAIKFVLTILHPLFCTV